MNDIVSFQSYPALSKIIHWLTALIFLGLLCVGFYMVSMPFGDDKFYLYAMHKSFGLFVLALSSVRLFTLFFVSKPGPLSSHAIWEKFLSKAAHVFLYAALIVLPLSGWVMSSAGDFPVTFFGLAVPDITDKNADLFEASRDVHKIYAFCALGVIFLHLMGALKHHFIDRDETLKRMTYRRFGIIGGVALSFTVFALYVPSFFMASQQMLKSVDGDGEELKVVNVDSDIQGDSVSQPVSDLGGIDLQKWGVIDQDSFIQFQVTQYGQPFEGRFQSFSADIGFDPDDLDQSYALVDIDIASIATGSADRDEQARSEEWFHVNEYPRARFQSTSFERRSGDAGVIQYFVHGDLVLRGVRLPISFPFTLDISDNEGGQRIAIMKAFLSLNRLDFGVGQGKWQKDDAIGNNVDIQIILKARAL